MTGGLKVAEFPIGFLVLLEISRIMGSTTFVARSVGNEMHVFIRMYSSHLGYYHINRSQGP